MADNMKTITRKDFPFKLRRDRRGLSPAISSTIITSAVIVMILVTVVFANNYLTQRMAENEFNAMQQFMQTVGLQIDDVAWTIGRTQTIRYASSYGQVDFESPALNYTVYVNDVPIVNFTTGMLLFNMPISKYNLGDNHTARLYPQDRSFLQQGTTAPVCHVFVVEIVPMSDGSYIRIVAAPSIRMLNSTITTDGTINNYYNFYLPILNQGNHPRLSQSVTLQGTQVNAQTIGDVSKIKITVDFPNVGLGFNSPFFNFKNLVEEILVPSGSILEFYTSEVIVSLGLQG
jgi:hypothetical protein